MTTSNKQKAAERVPLHKQDRMVATHREGFKRMYVNENPGNVERFQRAGWVLVHEVNAKTHDERSDLASQMDSVVRIVVNKGFNASCRTAVLMEIPLEFYLEDQAAEQKLIDEKANKIDPLAGKKDYYGDVKQYKE